MLRTTSGLSRSLSRWVSQVTASLGATLVATMIYSALPKPVFSTGPTPQPELTSGGKFAARVLEPTAFDGLDAMPLPHVAGAPFAAAPFAAAASVPVDSIHRAAWNGAASLVLAPEAPIRAAKPMRVAARIEPRRAVVASAEPSASARLPVLAEPVSDATDRGFMPRIVPALLSTVRDAFRLTASAGGTLVAHVVPQIP